MFWRHSFLAAALFAAALTVHTVAAQTDSSDAAADRDALAELVERLKQDNADLTAALSQQDRLAAELKKAQDGVTDLQQKLDSSGSELSASQKRVTDMEQTLADRDSAIATLEQQLSTSNSELKAAQQRASELTQTLDQSQQTVTGLEQQVTDKDGMIVAKDDMIASNKAILEQQNGMITSLRTRVSQLQQAQETALAAAQKAQRGAQRYRTMLGNARNNSRALDEEHQTRLSTLQESHTAALKESRGHVSTLGVKLREARSERDGLAGQLRNTQLKLADLNNKQYVVKRGDSLSKIARSFYGDSKQWRPIFQANRGLLNSPDGLAEGMTLKIPPR